MKKWMKTSMVGLFAVSAIISGCSKTTNEQSDASATSSAKAATTDSAKQATGKKVTLTLYSTATDKATQDVYKKIGSAYTKDHTNVSFEFQFPGQDYENILKMKMAANDLPDLFDTHGWAQIRYGKYVADLGKEPWVSSISDSMKPVITDKAGKVYALPLNAAKDGLTYNKDVLDKYKIEVPKTIDELIAAGEKIKKESKGEVDPFFFSATDAGSMAQFFDYYATSLLISPKDNQADALLNGSFDWSKWTPLVSKFKEMYDKRLMSTDVLTVRESDRPRLFAEGKIAFVHTAPGFVGDALKINPNVKAGIMPVPAIVEGDQPTFSGGERFTLAAWKDGKNLDAAKDVINFFANPDNLKALSEASGTPAAINGIKPDLGAYTEYYDKYKDIRVFPYFDRVYLPAGCGMCCNPLPPSSLAEN
ncbi:extracellular solute-binding protein [Paenibacillus alginolyticus]|uniref:ABC transporter substrate-binding protein n=1 Tax=Paenibacillus alginolyticus TaxID=59839 RepID=UPI00040FAA8C|nr:extracellular solute-binding protein [Paenibacillus alginolyticus]MCY9670788.1 extracellular solute-binding protein [Paenibacillus alginolyticus]